MGTDPEDKGDAAIIYVGIPRRLTQLISRPCDGMVNNCGHGHVHVSRRRLPFQDTSAS
jgi:hypothetical protein